MKQLLNCIVTSILASYFLTIGCSSNERPSPESEKIPSPITVIATEEKGFATFTNKLHPDNAIGYRFFEHSPIVFGLEPKNNDEAGIVLAEDSALEKQFANRSGVLTQEVLVEQKDLWIRQDWTFYLAPAADGIDLLFVIKTYDHGLSEYYGVQQCFRMSGATNEAWRGQIANTPDFSEYDLWHQEKDLVNKTSLTFVLRNGEWEPLPAIPECVGSRTGLGVAIDKKRTGGSLPEEVGPYKAKMFEPIDNGLITRTNKEGTWLSGIYWENTSHVTNHHPADCLHAIVNIGNIPANSKRAVRGKIYWFKGSKEDLTRKFQEDF